MIGWSMERIGGEEIRQEKKEEGEKEKRNKRRMDPPKAVSTRCPGGPKKSPR